jgi:hypothetical protein
MAAAARAAGIEHTIGMDGLLVLRLEDGDVRITGVAGDRATVRASDGVATDGLLVERGERSLSVSTGGMPQAVGHRRRGRSDDADLIVEAPVGATVVLESRSGDVRAARLTGDVRLTSASGDVSVRDAGGRLVVDAVSGDVEVTATGELDLSARTVSGDLELRAGVVRALQATTTSGDITLVGTFQGDGSFSVETVSGDTAIESPRPVRIEATTLTGDIHGPNVDHRSGGGGRPVVLGSGDGPTITFRSTSGDLSVRVADEAARRAAVAPSPPATPDRSLEVLRALERGDIDVTEATRRLSALEEG